MATAVHVWSLYPDPRPPRVLLSIPSIVNDIDARDEDGWTALHAAVYWENMEGAEMLVKKGANINVVTKTVSSKGYGRRNLYRVWHGEVCACVCV